MWVYSDFCIGIFDHRMVKQMSVRVLKILRSEPLYVVYLNVIFWHKCLTVD